MTGFHLRWLGCAVTLTVGLISTPAAPLSAHPGSTTAISADITDQDAYVIEIHIDAEGLATKLEVMADDESVLRRANTDADLRSRLVALTDVLLDHTRLAFDGRQARPRLTDITVDAQGQAVVRLKGEVPAGGKFMTWSTPLVFAAYPFAIRGPHRSESIQWIQGSDESQPVLVTGRNASNSGTQFARGVWLGFTHILPKGLDHILFVVGLLLISPRARDLFVQVTCFTLAHSITLGLSLYGAISLPSAIVEPLIAMSVAYVGIENLLTKRVRPWRFAAVFAFGLLHGLGFADVLSSLQLSREHFLSTLVSFNVGVELGQLAVLALAAAALRTIAVARHGAWRPVAVRFASATIAVMGGVWIFERIAM